MQRIGIAHAQVFSVALGNEHKQEQGLFWLLKGYLAADRELRSQTREEGHPQLKAARVVQRSTRPKAGKAQRMKAVWPRDSTWEGQAQKRQLSKTSFYIIKKRKAGSTHRHRDGEASQLPSAPQQAPCWAWGGKPFSLYTSATSQTLNFGLRICTSPLVKAQTLCCDEANMTMLLDEKVNHCCLQTDGEPGNHGLPGYFSALGRGEKASTSSQYTQTLPALGSISSSQRYKKEKDGDG